MSDLERVLAEALGTAASLPPSLCHSIVALQASALRVHYAKEEVRRRIPDGATRWVDQRAFERRVLAALDLAEP